MAVEQPIREPEAVTTIKTFREGDFSVLERLEEQRSRRGTYTYELKIGEMPAIEMTQGQFHQLQSLLRGI